jgi:hypothetical protein
MAWFSVLLLRHTECAYYITLAALPGDVIEISLPSETDDEMAVWRDAEKNIC